MKIQLAEIFWVLVSCWMSWIDLQVTHAVFCISNSPTVQVSVCCVFFNFFLKLNLLKLLGYWYSIIIRIVKWCSRHMLSCQDKASHGHERCRSHQITAHSFTTCNTGGSKVSTREHRPNTVLPTPSVSTIYRKVNLEPELFMVESKVQTAGYRFISRVLTLSCISECTDEIQNGRKGGRGKKKKKPRRGPGWVLNVWKSVLPIPAIKSEQQQAQTHNSECGWIAERCQDGFQLNQYLTFNMAAE